MKKLIITFILLMPLTALKASLFHCQGEGLTIELSENQSSLKIMGRGLDANISNAHISHSFDVNAIGNLPQNSSTLKLSINHSDGPKMKGNFVFSSPNGTKAFNHIDCTEENER
jgi:hypothetical protein